jgi:hypothetical protein
VKVAALRDQERLALDHFLMELLKREEDFRLNVLNCGLQLRPKELTDDTIFPQNRFKTLKRPLKKESLKNRHRCLWSRIEERSSKS